MISVIMPVYNSEKYLLAAVSSVLAAADGALEIIAVDDCSKDSSFEILTSLATKDPRVRPYRMEKNSGVAEVRNFALDKARGEFLAFCDSDDTVPDGAYRALLRAIGDKDIAVGGYRDITDSGSVTDAPVDKSARGNAFLTLFSVCCLWTKLIRRSFIEENGIRFDSDMRIGEDVVFLARAAAAHPSVAFTERTVYDHYYHDKDENASLTHVYTRRRFSEHLECRRRLLGICAAAGISEAPRYVYELFSGDLDAYLLSIPDAAERADAFVEYMEFLSGYDWSGREETFRAIHGIYYSEMKALSSDTFLSKIVGAKPRERLLSEFRTGKIGLRWVISYFKAWIEYKLSRD